MAVELLELRSLCVQIVDCPHSTPVWTDTGEIVLRSNNIRNGRLDLSNPSFTDKHHFDQRTRRATPRAGDLVITREAPMGEVCLIPEGLRCCLGQRMVLLRPDPAVVDSRYLLYALQSPEVQHEIGVNEGTGSTVSNLRIPLLEALRIPWRPLPEQRRIAHVLGTLDDKIELNRRMSQTLEEMARALFKSWFVDFDPVRAKAESRDPGLPKHLADLFPDRFVDSGLGPIPEGWEEELVGDHVECFKGRSYKSSELEASDTALVTLKSFMRGGGYRPDGLKPYTGSYKPSQVVKPGDLIVAATDVTQAAEVVGKPALVESNGRYATLVASLDVIVVEPISESVSKAFLYWLFSTDGFTRHARGHSTGTTVLHLAPQAVPNYSFTRPPRALVDAFSELAETIRVSRDVRTAESRTLVSVRETLLPRLMDTPGR